MNCHGGGSQDNGRKHTWIIFAVVAVLGIALWAGFGRGGLVGLLPFMGILLCPLIHGAMFLFMGKTLMQRSPQEQRRRPGQVETSPERFD